ncbi:MAG: cyclic nucleotide-binding domain-containing protein, partial [Myxococcaceae bacterium]|nr:cyclic nucleotide-binding domain-containing protein [Myxococcaceae bacterium]
EGEPGRAMWVIGDGCEVSMSATRGQARPVAVACVGAGAVIGEMALVDDGARSATAVVTRAGPAHQLDALEFHAMRSTFVPAAYKVLRKICLDLCTRLRATNERIAPGASRPSPTPSPAHERRPEPEELAAFPAFAAMPAVVKLALAQKLELIEAPAGAVLFEEGDRSDGAYFLVEGEVSVGRAGAQLSTLSAGAMFGLVACIDAGPRSAACRTVRPARLFRMSARQFETLFEAGHRVAYQMVDLVARQLVAHVRDATLLLARPTAKAPAPATPAAAAPPERADLELDQALPLEFELDLSDLHDVDASSRPEIG